MRWRIATTAIAVCILAHGAGTVPALAQAQTQAPAQAPAPAPAPAQRPDEFSFYGLRFGMTADEARKVLPLNPDGTEALEPKHGMRHLQLAYDYRGRLSEIRAAWERPADGLREAGLRLALRERFVQAIPARWRSISANLDEGANRAAITLVLVAQPLRQQEMEHYRDEYLRTME